MTSTGKVTNSYANASAPEELPTMLCKWLTYLAVERIARALGNYSETILYSQTIPCDSQSLVIQQTEP